MAIKHSIFLPTGFGGELGNFVAADPAELMRRYASEFVTGAVA